MIAIVVLSLAARIGLSLWLDSFDNHRPSSPPTTIAGELATTHPYYDTVSPRTLTAGACLDRVPWDFVRVVSCKGTHEAEIVSVFRYDAPPGGPYPAIVDLYKQSLDRCQAYYDDYTGTTADQTPASASVAVPSEGEWKGGERLIVCYATARNGGTLTAPLQKGAG